MHDLFAQVLREKDLSKAGDLFALDDQDIKAELSEVLKRIEEIAVSEEYSTSDNDQSVVEICITRVTSAIRETYSIEQHAAALVHLLESCLRRPLTPTSREAEPPHAKIASDILSTLFLNYSMPNVMEKALPVAIRFLQLSNKELNHNLSSYLSLAAIDNAKLLASQIHIILDSVIIQKNLRLSRVLPQIYSANKSPVQDQAGNLIHLLSECDMVEKSSILQLCSLVAQDKPHTLEPYIPLLCGHLSSTATASLVLHTFVSIAITNAESFVSHMVKLRTTVEQQPTTLESVAKIFGAVGCLNQAQGKESVVYLISQLEETDNHTQPVLLHEIKSICKAFPNLLVTVMSGIAPYLQSGSVPARLLMQQLKDMSYNSVNSDPEHKTVGSQTEGVVKVIDPPTPLLQSKNASTSTREISPSKTFPSTASIHKKSKASVMSIPRETSSKVPSVVSVRDVAVNLSQGGVARGPSLSYLQSSYPSNYSIKSSCVASNNNIPGSRPPSTLALSPLEEVRPSLTSTASIVTSVTTITRTTIAGSKAALDPGERRPISTVTTSTSPTYAGQPQAIPYRDAVQQFCEKHLEKIKKYIDTILLKLPLPIKATMEERNHKRRCRLHFMCLGREVHCLYQHNFFTHQTKNPRLWIHLMFLAIQARSPRAVSQQDPSVGNLKATWDTLRMESGNSFVRLVTSSFPTIKDQEFLLQELRSQRYFDVFEFNAVAKHWACFMCNHPERALGLLQDGLPSIAGQLKEKKGKWKAFKRWKTRYFTLSGAAITYSKTGQKTETLPISKIQSVKAVRKGMRDIPRAFEIFTRDETYVLKAKDGHDAEQWVQCLHIAVSKNQRTAEAGPEKVSELESMVQSWSNATRVNHRSRRAFGRILDSQTKL